MTSPALQYKFEPLYKRKGMTLKLNDITYDLVAEDVSAAIESITDPDYRGPVTIHIHRPVRGTGRCAHVEIHAVSIEVEARYVQMIDFSDRILVANFPRREFLTILRKLQDEYIK